MTKQLTLVRTIHDGQAPHESRPYSIVVSRTSISIPILKLVGRTCYNTEWKPATPLNAPVINEDDHVVITSTDSEAVTLLYFDNNTIDEYKGCDFVKTHPLSVPVG